MNRRRNIIILLYLAINAILTVVIALPVDRHFAGTNTSSEVSPFGFIFSTPLLVLYAALALAISRRNAVYLFILINIMISVYWWTADHFRRDTMSPDYGDASLGLFFISYPIGRLLFDHFRTFFFENFYIAGGITVIVYKVVVTLLSVAAYYPLSVYLERREAAGASAGERER